jgi:RNA polymerase sigma factor (sigma-70 family)
VTKHRDQWIDDYPDIKAHLRNLFYWFFGSSSTKYSADDFSQEVLSRFVARYRKARIDNVSAYLTIIAVNYGWELLRKDKQRRELLSSSLTLSDETSDPRAWEGYSGRATQEELMQDLAARLPERLRQVFLMRSRNMTIEQIAESLRLPKPTIQTYVSLAIATIKKELAKERKREH